jgi:hypothetical protein
MLGQAERLCELRDVALAVGEGDLARLLAEAETGVRRHELTHDRRPAARVRRKGHLVHDRILLEHGTTLDADGIAAGRVGLDIGGTAVGAGHAADRALVLLVRHRAHPLLTLGHTPADGQREGRLVVGGCSACGVGLGEAPPGTTRGSKLGP